MQDLKRFRIYDCRIDKRDKHLFENLTSLIYLEIENCKFKNIKFNCLFNSEKEYVIEELILIKIELYRSDIDLITAFKHLNPIVFDCCYTPDKCFLKIDSKYILKLEYLNISYSVSSNFIEEKNHLLDQMSMNSLIITSHSYHN
ncbi:hypothetical protein CWI38_0407p0030 [Hamiltosporidium tvaerminnensis]|uniref:Uncharacterized protein n=1 Tax=Hamiltosporidium tvaerminnensis TaxID=1176355 RepID=A0A4Q9M0G8_9MICR|nr:hypothetical protein CWI38_0407p0030 [Hamiltosporidium tvaerminnensis]